MKQFWVFTYDAYYPTGGMNDFKNSYDTLEEALDDRSNIDSEFVDIVDSHTGKMVFEGGRF